MAAKTLSSLRLILSDAERTGTSLQEILSLLDEERGSDRNGESWNARRAACAVWSLIQRLFTIIPCLFIGFLLHAAVLQVLSGSFCVVPMPMVIAGMMTPPANCDVCQGVTGAPRLVNPSRKEFVLHHAHTSRPIVVVGAALNWSAVEVFSYEYFRRIYQRFPDAIDSDGQFFSYSSNIQNLKELFELSSERATMTSERWYIGWSTSDPLISQEIKSHVSTPYFLSPTNRDNDLTWIFMGAPGPGASLHIDSVGEPSWQAQLSGTKTWTLVPPVECEPVCATFTVTVNRGDIIVVDTNWWYHQTFIHAGNVSITVGAEFR